MVVNMYLEIKMKKEGGKKEPDKQTGSWLKSF